MDIKILSPDISVAPQISVDDVARIKAAGFGLIVCHRPDGEGDGQPPHADPSETELRSKFLLGRTFYDEPGSHVVEKCSDLAGLAFRYQPVVSDRISDTDVETFAHLIARLPKPILADCRAEARSSALRAHALSFAHSDRE